MTRFSGLVGFRSAEDQETSPGIHESLYTEYRLTGDYSSIRASFQESSNKFDELRSNNVVSVIGNGFAWRNYQLIQYVILQGVKWKVESVIVDRPRLILSLGGVWNGQ